MKVYRLRHNLTVGKMFLGFKIKKMSIQIIDGFKIIPNVDGHVLGVESHRQSNV